MSKKIIYIGIAVALIAGIFVFPKFMLFWNSRKTTENTISTEFLIDSKMNLVQLAEKLQAAGIIDNKDAFIAVGDYKGMTAENIAIGKYIIEPATEFRNVLNGFKLNNAGNGNNEVEVDVTFNNCRDIYQMAGKVAHSLMIDSTKLVQFIEDEATLEKYQMNSGEIPVLFLPNTYKMYFDTDEKTFVQRMADEFKRFWNDERLGKLKEVGLKYPSEAVTLASIVYSEQGRNKSEWPIIAGLYLNRIQQGIKLQSDPTFKFCWGDQLKGVQRLLNVHRDIDCLYNTYKIMGLPPGPICIPPTEVVDAVLNRDKNNYIFMMAKADYSGLHDFSVDYSKHKMYAEKYQRWLANELRNN
jgi:UPF0755 protein